MGEAIPPLSVALICSRSCTAPEGVVRDLLETKMTEGGGHGMGAGPAGRAPGHKWLSERTELGGEPIPPLSVAFISSRSGTAPEGVVRDLLEIKATEGGGHGMGAAAR